MIAQRKLPATAALAVVLFLLVGCQGAVRELENVFQPDLHPALSLDDVRLASKVMQQALETKAHGEFVSWSNPETGFSGTFTLVRTYQTEKGVYCREFTERLRSPQDHARYNLTACRTDEGFWQVH
ncbi:MAG TPA: RT0821/Lpp0805 family surface protein [Alphaproteobacteria bacterium]|nr:RT0821/Lpp0805 family surface protein [Alphaproteobacteria bacterium]